MPIYGVVFLTPFHNQQRTLDRRLEENVFLGAPLAAWVALGAGGLIAIIDNLFWTSRYTLNFIATLAHEMGHATIATFFGAPSFPAISLDGQAAAFHRSQVIGLAIVIWAFMGYWAYYFRHNRPVLIALVTAMVLYPLFAFTEGWRLLFFLGGHGTELAFAGICFFRAWTGGFTASTAERTAYATCGWFCFCTNLMFHLKLMSSRGFQIRYASGGSFGLTNDYIRVATDILGCSVSTVALLMLLVNIIVLPAAVVVAVWIWNRR
ncbi:MAG: hypothetical protein ACYTKC_15040 [Planctomycetota bacterium]|jgi:hypothetical protein